MTFLAPLLSGIVVGLAGMIASILGTITGLFSSGEISSDVSGILGEGGIDSLIGIFGTGAEMIPTYWLQIISGIYLIEIVFILTSTLVTVKSGRDELQKTAETGKNLKIAMMLYSIVAFLAIVGLTILAAIALKAL